MLKALIIGLRLERAAALAQELCGSGMQVWVASDNENGLPPLGIEENIFTHRLFHNRNASLYELFDAMDKHPGELDLVVFETSSAYDKIAQSQLKPDPNTVAVITIIAQSIRRMESHRSGSIYICDKPSRQRNFPFLAFFTKTQTLKQMVEGAASEAKASGIRIEYLASAEFLGEADHLTHHSTQIRAGNKGKKYTQPTYI